jgi:hypothetical protein
MDKIPCVGCICFSICQNKNWIQFFRECVLVTKYYTENRDRMNISKFKEMHQYILLKTKKNF